MVKRTSPYFQSKMPTSPIACFYLPWQAQLKYIVSIICLSFTKQCFRLGTVSGAIYSPRKVVPLLADPALEGIRKHLAMTHRKRLKGSV